jgi:hypothetical protein
MGAAREGSASKMFVGEVAYEIVSEEMNDHK